MGMWGAAMSNVLVKNMSIIFSVIVQHNYLIYAVIGVFSLSIIGAFYFKPKEEKTRNNVSDFILNVVGIFIMSQYEPYPNSGVVIGAFLAVAVHMFILLQTVGGVALTILTSIQNVLSFVLSIFVYPLKPIIWILKTIWSVLRFFGPKDKVLINPQTDQEYRDDGMMNTAMEVENLRVNHVDKNSRAYRRTRHVEPGADTAGALSPARDVRPGYSRFDNLARSRGTTPQQARAWSRTRDMMTPTHELGDDEDITEEELDAAMKQWQ